MTQMAEEIVETPNHREPAARPFLHPGIEQCRIGRKVQGIAKKADVLFRDLVQQWEIAELLTCLEQDEECQSRAGAETLCQGQRRFFLGRTITSVQLLVAQRMWKPGIGGAVDRGHVEPAFLSSGSTENPSETG